ncbi:MAG: indolepyruvate ferredoxin oxidoreductase subunit beta [Methanomicrobiales archaeon]|nr:indolepyruvate ferredoxin oxidoreductase subunit beta [Methanomicrobiales archaeon]
MKESYDILIVGVGGQGTILTSNVLGEACLIEGKSVRGAETHGMAQRGGSVETHIRINGVHGPLIPAGEADIVIALELIEALRFRHYSTPEGVMVVNRELIVPASVYAKKLEVPTMENILERLSDSKPCVIDANALALQAGSALTQNIVMVGAASRYLPLSEHALREAVRRCVPEKTIDVNLAAFALGRDASASCR